MDEHFSERMPELTSVLGWSKDGENMEYPRFGSAAPYTIRPIWAHPKAAAHMGHGSNVTYNVQSVRYLPPTASVAAVIAIISACAVGS